MLKQGMIPLEAVERRIFLIRGQKVMLSTHLQILAQRMGEQSAQQLPLEGLVAYLAFPCYSG